MVRSSRAGFTAPELLNLLVLGAILAAIVYGQRRAHPAAAVDPQIAPMRAALEDLQRAQDRYHGATGRYTTRLDSLGVTATAGITRVIDRADTSGWHATAEREGTTARCEITAGAARPDSVVCRSLSP